jgi:hypothetical protein
MSSFVARLECSEELLALRPLTFSENLGEWHAHALHRLQDQVDISADPVLIALHREIQSYPAPAPDPAQHPDVFVPYRVRTSAGLLSFMTTTRCSVPRLTSLCPR